MNHNNSNEALGNLLGALLLHKENTERALPIRLIPLRKISNGELLWDISLSVRVFQAINNASTETIDAYEGLEGKTDWDDYPLQLKALLVIRTAEYYLHQRDLKKTRSNYSRALKITHKFIRRNLSIGASVNPLVLFDISTTPETVNYWRAWGLRHYYKMIMADIANFKKGWEYGN